MEKLLNIFLFCYWLKELLNLNLNLNSYDRDCLCVFSYSSYVTTCENSPSQSTSSYYKVMANVCRLNYILHEKIQNMFSFPVKGLPELHSKFNAIEVKESKSFVDW